MKRNKVVKLKKLLPKGYRISTSKTGLSLYVSHKLKANEFIEDADAHVEKAAKKLNLDEVGRGCGFGERDWHLIDCDVEKTLVADAKKLHANMKAFFKKWSNSYCESCIAYDYIEKMRVVIETDEA